MAPFIQACAPRSPVGGAVAQMGERCNRTAEVRGSIPLGSTNPEFSIFNSPYHLERHREFGGSIAYVPRMGQPGTKGETEHRTAVLQAPGSPEFPRNCQEG